MPYEKQKWKDVPIKNCSVCNVKIGQNRRYGKRAIFKYEYKKLICCSVRCSNEYNTWKRIQRGDKIENNLGKYLKRVVVPDREMLNKMFNRLRNYSAMGRELGVSHQAIRRWLGNKHELTNPTYYGTPWNKPVDKDDVL